METIKIDNEVVRVTDMPEQLQNMVVLYEEVLNQEVDARKDLAIKEAARMEITKRVITGWREVKANVSAAVDEANGQIDEDVDVTEVEEAPVGDEDNESQPAE